MIDLTYLKNSTNNDIEIIKQLIDLFVTQLPELKDGITNAFKSKNLKELRELSHKAKNSFQILGASSEANNLKDIEMMASKTVDIKSIEPLYNNFMNSCKAIVEEIAQLKL